jgi:hypothetical protein
MNDPPRLFKQGATRFERAALRSASLDVGSDAAWHRALAAMGAAAAGSPAAAGAALGRLGGWSIAKWGSVVAATGILVWGAAGQIGQEPSPPLEHPPQRSIATPHLSASRWLPESVDAPVPSVPARALVCASDSHRRTQSRVSASMEASRRHLAVAPRTGNQLGREVALLDEARAALARGDAHAAAAALDRREREVGKGVLGPEATVTRVEVLLRAHKRAQAIQVGEQFLARQSRGPHADRLRSLLRRARSGNQ